MTTVNPVRGEVTITLQGRERRLAPTWAAIVEMEQGTGHGVVTLYRRATALELSMSELAVIITAGLHGAGESNAEVRKVGPMLMDSDVLTVNARIGKFLGGILNGGQKEGNGHAVEKPTQNGSLSADSWA